MHIEEGRGIIVDTTVLTLSAPWNFCSTTPVRRCHAPGRGLLDFRSSGPPRKTRSQRATSVYRAEAKYISTVTWGIEIHFKPLVNARKRLPFFMAQGPKYISRPNSALEIHFRRLPKIGKRRGSTIVFRQHNALAEIHFGVCASAVGVHAGGLPVGDRQAKHEKHDRSVPRLTPQTRKKRSNTFGDRSRRPGPPIVRSRRIARCLCDDRR